MLVLSRKVGERIHIGDDIVVEVRRIAGNRVTIALKAPQKVRILRGELEAAATAFDDDGALADEVPQPNSGGVRPQPVLIPGSLRMMTTHDSGTHVAM
jgi:carbon storage regulator